MNIALFHKALEDWYAANHRVLPWRETADPYKIWISEIILQQTRVDQGMAYYLRFIDCFPDVRCLAQASEDEVLRLWQGLGYYSRARNIHKAAQQIIQEQMLVFLRPEQAANRPESTFQALRSLPGIGDYTAGAIASFAFNLPYPAMDGNVYRVLARLTDSDIAFDASTGKKHFHAVASEWLDKEQPRLFNNAIMEFGALYCVPQHPDCTHCPLQCFCMGYAHHTVDLLPVRKPRPKIKDRYFIYTIYVSKGCTLIRQRQEKDIWQHLWEFPLEEVDATTWQEKSAKGLFIELKHQLSHQLIHARFVVIKAQQLPTLPDTQATRWSDLDDYALSRLTLSALHQLGI